MIALVCSASESVVPLDVSLPRLVRFCGQRSLVRQNAVYALAVQVVVQWGPRRASRAKRVEIVPVGDPRVLVVVVDVTRAVLGALGRQKTHAAQDLFKELLEGGNAGGDHAKE